MASGPSAARSLERDVGQFNAQICKQLRSDRLVLEVADSATRSGTSAPVKNNKAQNNIRREKYVWYNVLEQTLKWTRCCMTLEDSEMFCT